MSRTIEELISYVNEHIAYHAREAERQAKNPWKSKRHAETVEVYKEIVAALAAEKILTELAAAPAQPISEPKQLRLWLSPDEVDGLPPELIQELSAASVDKTELAILEIIAERGGIASLDQILIGLFHRLKEVHKRTALTSKLYRMSQRKQIFAVPGKKGAYSAREISEEEAKKLFGDFEDS